MLEHGLELALHRFRRSPLIDVVDAGDDHDEIRAGVDDVAYEARADLIAPLTVDAAIQHTPVGMGPHQPVRVLTLDVALRREAAPRAAI